MNSSVSTAIGIGSAYRPSVMTAISAAPISPSVITPSRQSWTSSSAAAMSSPNIRAASASVIATWVPSAGSTPTVPPLASISRLSNAVIARRGSAVGCGPVARAARVDAPRRARVADDGLDVGGEFLERDVAVWAAVGDERCRGSARVRSGHWCTTSRTIASTPPLASTVTTSVSSAPGRSSASNWLATMLGAHVVALPVRRSLGALSGSRSRKTNRTSPGMAQQVAIAALQRRAGDDDRVGARSSVRSRASHGQRSSSVSGSPADILATLAGGWTESASRKSAPMARRVRARRSSFPTRRHPSRRSGPHSFVPR